MEWLNTPVGDIPGREYLVMAVVILAGTVVALIGNWLYGKIITRNPMNRITELMEKPATPRLTCDQADRVIAELRRNGIDPKKAGDNERVILVSQYWANGTITGATFARFCGQVLEHHPEMRMTMTQVNPMAWCSQCGRPIDDHDGYRSFNGNAYCTRCAHGMTGGGLHAYHRPRGQAAPWRVAVKTLFWGGVLAWLLPLAAFLIATGSGAPADVLQSMMPLAACAALGFLLAVACGVTLFVTGGRR